MLEADQIEAKRKSEEKLLSSEPRKFWQSYQELNEAEDIRLAVRAKEFSEGQKESLQFELPSVTRRRFLQWMGAASALMTGAACKRRETDYLVPYVNKPQGYVMGMPVWYASVAPNGSGILVKTREGKPIKLEGNPEHPLNRGGLDVQTQSLLLDFFNPERIRAPQIKGKPASWAEADQYVKNIVQGSPAGSVRLLTGPVLSPTLKGVIEKFLASTKAKHHFFRPVSDAPVLEALDYATGKSAIPSYRFDKAEVVVSFDSDFLGAHDFAGSYTKGFSSRRKAHRGGREHNQLFVFESQYSITGVAADYRVPVSPSHFAALIFCLTYEVAKKLGASDAEAVFGRYAAADVLKEVGVNEGIFANLVKALVDAKGRSIVIADGRCPLSFEVQLATLVLNSMLKNIGSTIDLSGERVSGFDAAESYSDLLKDAEGGKVETLIIAGANPGYQQLSGEFDKALSKIKNLVFIGSELDETAGKAQVVLAESMFLECWSDSSVRRGVFSIQQPVIQPLFTTRSLGEILSAWLGDERDYSEIVKDFWRKSIFSGNGSFEDWWQGQLKSGVVTVDRLSGGSQPTVQLSKVLNLLKAETLNRKIPSNKSLSNNSKVEIVLYPSLNLRDGARASNAWLQEMPDPISKVTWSNYIAVSPSLAKSLGLREDLQLGHHSNDVVELTVDGKTLSLPAHIQPGLKDNVVTVALGYGRSAAGSVGTMIGKNPLVLASASGARVFAGILGTIKKTSETKALATTQRHFELEGRDKDILQTATLSDFLKKKEHGEDHEAHGESKHETIYNPKEFVYPGNKWGMVIDLNSCTGCNACVVACYSENNIGIVGEDQVFKGRHMAWLRLDLYYSGSPEAPEANFEPMLCQQCESAPCETVCPVLATVHSSDGLNDMIYNRCVGTRYCANNCPYKVRRFNYFQYTDSLGKKIDFQDPLPLMLNPDVTVRSRGVMEKCTFCVQRIRKVADEARDEKRRVQDGAIKTACQQSCPADAIVFGDLNDTNSEVSKLSKGSGNFKILEILNTKPSITYLPRLRNKGDS